MAKNGILIVEFANQLRDRGLSVREAIEEASNIRLRPVLMTMIATVLGGVPLVIAGGAGAEARAALGWVIVGGLGFAAVSTLYLTPVAYLILARFCEAQGRGRSPPQRELDAPTGTSRPWCRRSRRSDARPSTRPGSVREAGPTLMRSAAR